MLFEYISGNVCFRSDSKDCWESPYIGLSLVSLNTKTGEMVVQVKGDVPPKGFNLSEIDPALVGDHTLCHCGNMTRSRAIVSVSKLRIQLSDYNPKWWYVGDTIRGPYDNESDAVDANCYSEDVDYTIVCSQTKEEALEEAKRRRKLIRAKL